MGRGASRGTPWGRLATRNRLWRDSPHREATERYVDLSRMKHRHLFLIAIVSTAVVLGTLVGCGAIGEKYKVIEWSANYFEKYFPRWMDDFSAEHADDNVRIKFRAMVSDAAQKVYTMLISHTLSDVIIVGTETQSLLIDNNALERIPDDYIPRQHYMPLALAVPSYGDGSLAAIPYTVGIRPFMYFDVADLREVGTSVEDAPVLFEPYREWAARFLKWEMPDGSIVAGSLSADEAAKATNLRRPLLLQRGHVLSVYPFILAYFDVMPDENGESDNSLDDFLGGPPSGRPFRFDTPEFVRGLTEWRDFFISETGATADGDTGRIEGLTAGKYASCEAGNWIFGEVFSVNMEASALPHAEGKPLRLPVGVGSHGISRETPHKELAMAFARYISEVPQQLDGYYGHGYLPSRFDAWDAIHADDVEDAAIRQRFLAPYVGGNEDFIGQPRIKRTYHDRMEIQVFVPLSSDETLMTWSSKKAAAEVGEGEAAAADAAEDAAAGMAEKYGATLQQLAEDIAAMTAQEVTVVLQGTPDEMVAVRSVVPSSPVGMYMPHLRNGVYVPVHKLWSRLQPEVIVRAQQFVTHPDAGQRMSPEEAAKWCQEEAEAIVAGTK